MLVKEVRIAKKKKKQQKFYFFGERLREPVADRSVLLLIYLYGTSAALSPISRSRVIQRV